MEGGGSRSGWSVPRLSGPPVEVHDVSVHLTAESNRVLPHRARGLLVRGLRTLDRIVGEATADEQRAVARLELVHRQVGPVRRAQIDRMPGVGWRDAIAPLGLRGGRHEGCDEQSPAGPPENNT